MTFWHFQTCLFLHQDSALYHWHLCLFTYFVTGFPIEWKVIILWQVSINNLYNCFCKILLALKNHINLWLFMSYVVLLSENQILFKMAFQIRMFQNINLDLAKILCPLATVIRKFTLEDFCYLIFKVCTLPTESSSSVLE